MVGLQTLDLAIGVRVPASQPNTALCRLHNNHRVIPFPFRQRRRKRVHVLNAHEW
jgi:hypothetical protein